MYRCGAQGHGLMMDLAVLGLQLNDSMILALLLEVRGVFIVTSFPGCPEKWETIWLRKLSPCELFCPLAWGHLGVPDCTDTFQDPWGQSDVVVLH